MGNTKSSCDVAFVKLITPKGIVRFICLFVLFFGLFMIPWPTLGRAYTRVYSASAALLFGSFGSTGIVRFEPSSDCQYELYITLYNQARKGSDGGIARIQTCHNSRHAGYAYLSFLAALILATPIPFRRKGWALLCGAILIHGLIALQLWLRILHTFAHEPLSMLALSPLCKHVLSVTHKAFAVNVTFGFILCFFIWVLVAFRRGEWNRIAKPRIQR